MKSRLDNLDIQNCKTLTIHVGGNDASDSEELDTLRDKYETLLESVSDGNRRVLVSELLPRGDVDLEPYNEELRSLCVDNAVEFVENFNGFLLATGELPDTFFYTDKVHINAVGTRRLLANIDKLHRVTRDSAPTAQRTYKQRIGSYTRNCTPRFKHFRPSRQFCHICCRNGSHSTQECWYNVRGNGFVSRTR